jgi:hypothetical protein
MHLRFKNTHLPPHKFCETSDTSFTTSNLPCIGHCTSYRVVILVTFSHASGMFVNVSRDVQVQPFIFSSC